MTILHEHKAARQYSDQYHCSECGCQWDVNDPYPPKCRPVTMGSESKAVVKMSTEEHIRELRGKLHETK